jgi:hypothetical protein
MREVTRPRAGDESVGLFDRESRPNQKKNPSIFPISEELNEARFDEEKIP